MAEIKEFAHTYIAHNWPVFPCNPLDKRPLTEHGFKDASTDPEQIEAWWQRWPNAMIGVPMGAASGVFCIDLDIKEKVNGVDMWSMTIASEHVEDPPTRQHNTPSGGRHYIFKWIKGIRNIPLSKLLPGIEIKADGGYIVVPPSRMGDGREYKSNGLEILDAPAWLIKRINDYRISRGEEPVGDLDDDDYVDPRWSDPEYLRQQEEMINEDLGKGVNIEESYNSPNYGDGPDIEEIKAALDSIPADGYEDWYKLGAAIYKELGDGGYQMFRDWSATSSKFNDRECHRKWKQVQNVQGISIGTVFYYADLNDAGWRERFEERRESKREQKQEEVKPQTNKRYRLLLLPHKTWDNGPIPDPEYAVAGRIPLENITLFSGEGATGKSYIQLHLSVAHALGKEWMGVRVKQGPAIFIDAEDPENVIRWRMDKVNKHYGVKFADSNMLHLVSLYNRDPALVRVSRKSSKLETTEFFKDLYEMVGDIQPVMVGICSSADVFTGNEIDRSQVRQFFATLRKIAILGKCAINLIAHPSLTGMANQSGISGSTAWHNSARARIFLKYVLADNDEANESDSGVRRLIFKKNQYGGRSETVLVKWSTENGMFLPLSTSESRDEVVRAVFLRILERFNNMELDCYPSKGKGWAPGLFAEEPEAKPMACTKDELADAMRTLLADELIVLQTFETKQRNKVQRLIINKAKYGFAPTHADTTAQETLF